MTSSDAAASWEAIAEVWTERIRANGDLWRPAIIDPAHLALAGDVRGLDVLDIGCGEGRFARMLAQRGAHVTAVDVSATMVRMAEELEAESPLGIRYFVRDAAQLDGLAVGSFDMAVAVMSVMDMEDYRAALREAARILEPGGSLAFSLLHPCYDMLPPMGWGRDEDGTVYFKVDDTLTARAIDGPIWIDQPETTVIGFHRSVSDYAHAVRDAGLLIRDLLEPQPTPESIAAHPELEVRRRIPGVLIFDCLKPERNA